MAITSVLAKLWDLESTQMASRDKPCQHCGSGMRSARVSIAELVAGAVCCCLLLTIFMIAGSVAYRWIDQINQINRINREGPRLFDGQAWHEPLDDWSL